MENLLLQYFGFFLYVFMFRSGLKIAENINLAVGEFHFTFHLDNFSVDKLIERDCE